MKLHATCMKLGVVVRPGVVGAPADRGWAIGDASWAGRAWC